MPKYEVRLPVAGYAALIIEADSEEAAIEAGILTPLDPEDIQELTALIRLTTGKVSNAPLDEAEVSEIIEEDDNAET